MGHPPLQSQGTEPFPQSFRTHEVLMPLPDVLWKIERGVVRTTTWSEEGAITTLGFWGPGDVVGRCLSTLNPYQMECLTDVQVSGLRSHLWAPTLEAILRHAQHTEELLNIANCQRVPVRLIRLLLWLEQKFGQAASDIPDGRLIDLRLTHQVLAEATNTTRVTVTRLLSQLNRQGKIKRSRGRLILLPSLSLLD